MLLAATFVNISGLKLLKGVVCIKLYCHFVHSYLEVYGDVFKARALYHV